MTFGLAAMGQGSAGTRDAQIKSSPIGFLLLAQRRLPPATFNGRVIRPVVSQAFRSRR
ncbi:hypothetical protein ACFYWX_02755 [Streptomyces sp. NPDC002888]|uniref:hypothetical protein n=1 Tax=Streptomyces sp. NPDC002888 TaxID=3364668 RepID=UPI0036A45C13